MEVTVCEPEVSGTFPGGTDDPPKSLWKQIKSYQTKVAGDGAVGCEVGWLGEKDIEGEENSEGEVTDVRKIMVCSGICK